MGVESRGKEMSGKKNFFCKQAREVFMSKDLKKMR